METQPGSQGPADHIWAVLTLQLSGQVAGTWDLGGRLASHRGCGLVLWHADSLAHGLASVSFVREIERLSLHIRPRQGLKFVL